MTVTGLGAALFAALALQAPAPGGGDPVTPPSLIEAITVSPVGPGRRDLPRVVLVEVTVDADGAPRDVALARGVGAPWDARALEAVARARFRPATRGGRPLAVRIVAPIEVGAPPSAAGVGRRPLEPTPTVTEGVEGVVLERGTRRPLAGLPVTLDDRETLTDPDGRFAFREVLPGSRRLAIPPFDHEAYEARVTAPASLTVRLTPTASRQYGTVIRGAGGATDDARIVVPMARAREVPGSSGDPIKVIESLPGVARPAAAGPGAGQISVRGSAPEDTLITLDGMPLFQLYHFGNIYSVLQDEWIQDIDYRPGGFSVEYGDAIGGFLGVTLADIPTDGVHGHVDLNIYHAAVLITAPVSDTWAVGAAFRRSWVDAILGAIVGDDQGFRFRTAPRYYDYQVRADHRPSPHTTWRLVAFGSDDLLSLLQDAPDPSDPDATGFRLRRFFHQVQGTVRTRLSDDLLFFGGLSTSYQRLELSPGGDAFSLTFDPVTLRADLDWRQSPTLRLRGGLLAEATRYLVEVSIPRPTKEGQVALPGAVRETIEATESGIAGRFGLYGEAVWRLAPALTLVGGLRLDAWLGTFEAAAPAARLALTWDAAAATRLSVSGGVTHQAPPPDEWAETTGNPGIGPERAAYVNAGVRQELGDLVSVELQGFYKALDQLVSPTGAPLGPIYDNAGAGEIVGGELLVRLAHPIVDGWVAYTLSRSRRTDRPGQPDRAFSFDQTHVLALVAGVQLGAGWRAGARFRYATGNPFTPLEPAYFDAGSDVWVPRAAAAPFTRRVADFVQLDLRVDKTILFDTWRLQLYLELNNATNRANVEAVGYSRDFTRREDIESLPITPSIGVRGSF